MINGARKQRVVSLESSIDYIKSAISSLLYVCLCVCVICICILHCHLCQRFRILIGNYRLGKFYFCLTWKNTNFICVAASPFPPPTSLPFASSFHCRCCSARRWLSALPLLWLCGCDDDYDDGVSRAYRGTALTYATHVCMCMCVCVSHLFVHSLFTTSALSLSDNNYRQFWSLASACVHYNARTALLSPSLFLSLSFSVSLSLNLFSCQTNHLLLALLLLLRLYQSS